MALNSVILCPQRVPSYVGESTAHRKFCTLCRRQIALKQPPYPPPPKFFIHSSYVFSVSPLILDSIITHKFAYISLMRLTFVHLERYILWTRPIPRGILGLYSHFILCVALETCENDWLFSVWWLPFDNIPGCNRQFHIMICYTAIRRSQIPSHTDSERVYVLDENVFRDTWQYCKYSRGK